MSTRAEECGTCGHDHPSSRRCKVRGCVDCNGPKARKPKDAPKAEPEERRVRIHFEGSIVVSVKADPEDAEAWSEAVGKAWADVSPEDISEAANTIGQHMDGDPLAIL